MTQLAFTVDRPDFGRAAARPWRIAAAVLISLLLHALFLYGARVDRTTPAPPEAGSMLAPMTVWLLPEPVRPPPPPPVTQVAPVEPPPVLAKRAPAASRGKPARRTEDTQRAADTSATAAVATVPATSTLAPVADAPAQPRFNMAAALATARSVATQPDPAKANTAVGQIPDKPLQTETKLARDIASGKRANCKDGVPGGLLAPIFLLMDKKDSGCKW